MGRANTGAAVVPDAALAGVASVTIMVQGHLSTGRIGTAIGIVVPLVVVGLGLTIVIRILAVAISHIMDKEVEKANHQGIEFW